MLLARRMSRFTPLQRSYVGDAGSVGNSPSDPVTHLDQADVEVLATNGR